MRPKCEKLVEPLVLFGVGARGLGLLFLFHLSLLTPEIILRKSLSEFYNPLNINLALTQHAALQGAQMISSLNDFCSLLPKSSF